MLKKTYFLFFCALTLWTCSDDDDMIETCNTVSNVNMSDLTDNSVMILWDDASTIGSYIVEYGTSGFEQGTGVQISSNETSVAISELNAMTTYDVYVQTICSVNNVSMLSEVFSFTTLEAPCNPIQNLTISDLTDTSVAIAWEDSFSVGSYEIEYGISGFTLGSGVVTTVSTLNYTLTGLLPNTAYDLYVTTICDVNNTSNPSDALSFTTMATPIVPEFRPLLSELNIYQGNMADLEPSPYAFEYSLSTKLFTDYAIKQRLIALPSGEQMDFNGDGLPIFPNNTVIAKTFYYNNDETDLSQGKNIIETRLLIKLDGSWEYKTYIWNDAQTDAVLDTEGAIVPVTWVNANGMTQNVDYEVPSETDCFTCHNNSNVATPIGPKLRTLNFEYNGSNQLQALIDNNMLQGLADPMTVSVLPNWEDTSLDLERRARAYMDINCAHCHTDGGHCQEQSNLRLAYETPFEESFISQSSSSILTRIQNTIPEYGMPLIGTTILHDEGVDLLIDYINSLE